MFTNFLGPLTIEMEDKLSDPPPDLFDPPQRKIFEYLARERYVSIAHLHK